MRRAQDCLDIRSPDAHTPYTIEKHAPWCLFLDGNALPIGRYARVEEALAPLITVSTMRHAAIGGRQPFE